MSISRLEYTLTNDEKLDYIYRELRREEQHRFLSRMWTWFWRIVFFVSMAYLYFYPESIATLTKSMLGQTYPSSISGIPADIFTK
jgi:hypothetical protein